MGIREWMIVIGILLLLAVLLDGLRRMRRERQDELSVAEKMSGGAQREDDDFPLDDFDSAAAVPVSKYKERIEPSVNDDDAAAYFEEGAHHVADYEVDKQDEQQQSAGNARAEQRPPHAGQRKPAPKSQPESQSESRVQSKWAAAKPKSRAVEKKQAASQAAASEQPVKEIIIVNVRATNDVGLNGADLLQILLACDMRFGKHKIFHRHEHKNGTGAIQFSMANAVEPGVFDLNNIEEFHTSGVTFFLSLPGPEDAIKAFDYMVETANVLANNLGGELRDADKCSMTAQTLEHHRQRVQEFERLQLKNPH